MTESSPVSHFQPAEGAILGGCGVPIPNTWAKIVDIDTGKALGPNQVLPAFRFHRLGAVIERCGQGLPMAMIERGGAIKNDI